MEMILDFSLSLSLSLSLLSYATFGLTVHLIASFLEPHSPTPGLMVQIPMNPKRYVQLGRWRAAHP